MWQWQRRYIFEDLMRHDVIVEVLNPLHFDNFEEANKSLLLKINKEHYDLIMTTNNEEVLFIPTLLEIKKVGIPTLLFCPDSLLIPYYYKNSCKYFDLVWLTSPMTINLFKSWGANTIVLPFAANPNYYNPDFENEINRICFVGTPHSNRTKILNTLLDSNISTTIYTKIDQNKSIARNVILPSKTKKLNSALNLIKYDVGRKLLRGSIVNRLKRPVGLNVNNSSLEILPPVSFAELPVVYSRYALSLATTSARHTAELQKPVDFILLRNFEIPMSGGLQVCSFSNEMSQYFDSEKEIIFYKDDLEFIDKTSFYLKPENHKLRIQMKLAARKRAESEHTWFNRFEKVFKSLEIQRY
jgi:spore maturation protein CgeB